MIKTVITPIAHIYTDFKEKFGIPRQSGRVKSAIGKIVFTPEFRTPEALRGLDGFNYVWLIFDFSLSHTDKWSPTVRPPRLGGNRRVGVFASRSPFRPNPLGLSSVKIERIEKTQSEGTIIYVSGVDLLDGTPIFDIKPYLPSDCHEDATSGFADEHINHKLSVIIPKELEEIIPKEKLPTLLDALADDPRPSYQHDPERVYSMRFCDFDVKFKIDNDQLTVIRIKTL